MKKIKSAMKFNNQRVVYDGYTFDSKAEYRRFGLLRMLERAGAITALEVHPAFPIVINGKRVAGYKADFSYMVDGVKKVEDVKPYNAKKGKFICTPVFNLRRKLVEAIHGITVELVK